MFCCPALAQSQGAGSNRIQKSVWFVLLTCQRSHSSNHKGSERQLVLEGGSTFPSRSLLAASGVQLLLKGPDWVSHPPGGQGQSFKCVHQDRWLSVGEDTLITISCIAYFMIFLGVGGTFWNKFQLHRVARATPLRTVSIRLLAPF